MSSPITEAEAKAEVDSINAEIAKSKGITIDAPADDQPGEEGEATKPKEEPAEPENPEEEEGEEGEEGEKPEPTGERKPGRTIPISKYQDTKKTLEGALKAAEENLARIQGEKDAEITRLTGELNKVKNSGDVAKKVKDYAEKHNVSEESVMDLVAIIGANPNSSLDPEAQTVLKKSADFIKKQEANEAFETEFADLLSTDPDAKDVRNQIRAEAFKESNLNRSLYEVYHRFVKSSVVPKKKTAESSRGGSRIAATGEIDFQKVADDIKAGKSGVLEKFSGEQQDKIFAWMEKSGSIYSKR